MLYENLGYPDNYTDTSFLRELKKNIDWKEVSLHEAISGSYVLVQELCIVVIFILVYVYLYNEWTDPHIVFYNSSLGTLIGFAVYRIKSSYRFKPVVTKDLRTVLIFIIFGHLFSPVLHTLTDTISTNTIYMMTFLMLLMHVIFTDYGVSAAIVSNSLSLSAAIFASVCLASRLATAYHAFALITFAIECFVLFPFVRSKIRKQLLPTLLLSLAIVIVLLPLSRLMTVIFISTLLFVNLFCPLLFYHFQKHKDNIYGPWDEAVIEDADSINNIIS